MSQLADFVPVGDRGLCRGHLRAGVISRAVSTLAFLIFISPWVVAAPSDGVSSDRPNVVMILADDQSYRDFGFMGNRQVHTPNLDALAADSARFPLGYVPMSVCRPSLATILTGLYPHQHGIHFNHPPPGLSVMRRELTGDGYHRARSTTDYLFRNVPTLPRLLSRHGYASLQTGKHWEGDFRTAGFTDGMTLGKPSDRISSVTGTRLQDNGDPVAHGNGDAGLVIGRETMAPIREFVDQHAGNQPFFVWYAPFLPHTPFDAGPRFHRPQQGKDIAEHLLPYYAEIARFDDTVGELIGILERSGVIDQTLIVFVSDNGFRPDVKTFDRHDRRSKLSVDEDGLRTPVLIRLPGVTRPGEHRQPVHTIDLLPTVLSAVGMSDEVTTRMKGVDLMPAARGETSLQPRAVFGAIYPNDARTLGEPSAHVRGRWVREGDFKLVIPGTADSPLVESLFELSRDPDETRNLIAQPQFAATTRRMRMLLDRWWSAEHDRDVTPALE